MVSELNPNSDSYSLCFKEWFEALFDSFVVDAIIDAFCYLGHPMGGHLKCEACGILIGEGHWCGERIKYRGHLLCSPCVKNWGTSYSQGTWEQFLHGK